ncbi:MAG: hypothetical protein QGG36_32255 [Pirellulaceae bacterium]|jgi:hypothetical protein|nr:hypothetical protein [Pirellulaceae bacterium]MDP7020517.1 hypothetical protein [Pirellulaceae bacterium]
MRFHRAAIILVVSLTTLLSSSQVSQAGPLLDWLLGRNRPESRFYRPTESVYYAPIDGYALDDPYGVPAFATTESRFRPQIAAPAYSDRVLARRAVTSYRGYDPVYEPYRVARPALRTRLLRPSVPCDGMTTCRPYAPQVVRSYRPQVSYRTSWQRVPVTYYRPESQVDPVTGIPVSYWRPCTSYRWQARRVPVHRWRPVYAYANPTFAPVDAYRDCPPGELDSERRYEDPYYGPTERERGRTEIREPADDRPRLDDTRLERNQRSALGRVDRPAAAPFVPPRPHSYARPESNNRYRPLNDPEADEATDPDEAPRLLNPRDRSASRQSIDATLAVWSVAKPAVRKASAASKPTVRIKQTSEAEYIDDGGWKSVHRRSR